MPMCGCPANTSSILSLQYQRNGLAASQRARVQRGESATARCASTGNRQASLLFFFLPLLLLPSIGGSGQGCPRLRATFSPSQPRARRDALLSQASTVSSCAFCEQGGHLAAPIPSLHLNIYGETLGCCCDLAGQRPARAATAKWKK